jgi:vitamin B12 transporter
MRSLALLTALLPAPALAQDIVVTGRGLEEGRGERVYDTVVIDRDRLTRSASGRLDEILKDVPGLQAFRRSDARSANPTSQGVTLRALGGNASSRALLLLDGVPQTDPFGGWINWPAYDPARLGAVRILRGGGTGASGPGALAGTIELYSADPAQLEGARARVFYGSRDSINARAGFGARLGQGFASFSASYGEGDGFVPVVAGQRGPIDRPSPYRQGSASLRAVAPLGGSVEIQANGLYFHDRRERGTPFSGNRTDGADASVRLVGTGAWGWSALLYVQARDYYNSFASIDAARETASRVAEQVSVPSTGIGARIEVRPSLGEDLELRVGGDWRRTAGETRELYAFSAGEARNGRVAGGASATIGAFAELTRQAGPFTLTGGARIDRWTIADGALDEYVLATGASLNRLRYEDRDGWLPTGRAGILYRAAEALHLRAAGYLGWRLPTLNELYRPFRVGADLTRANFALSPERLRGAEIGLDYRPLPTARIGMTLFTNRLEDAIGNVTLAANERQRQNLGAVEARGIEVDGRLDFGAWSLSGGYAWVDARVRASGPAASLSGLRPAQTPRRSGSATLAWQGIAGAHAALSVRYVGAQFEDDLNRQKLPGALTFDAVTGLRLTPEIGVSLRAENIGDTNVIAGISGDGLIERSTPRTLWIGLSFGEP